MPTAVVTGANRGIGLEFCRQLAQRGYHVVALCHKSSRELSSLDVHIEKGIDVREEKKLKTLKRKFKTHIDLLINCAGVLYTDDLKNPNYDIYLEQFDVNALGPLRVTRAFLPLLSKGSKIMMISSRAGSLAREKRCPDFYGYRMSKTALNMLSVCLATELKPKGIAVGIFHPGYVKTRMVDFKGDIEPHASVNGMLEKVEDLNLRNTGTFWDYKGNVVPW